MFVTCRSLFARRRNTGPSTYPMTNQSSRLSTLVHVWQTESPILSAEGPLGRVSAYREGLRRCK